MHQRACVLALLTMLVLPNRLQGGVIFTNLVTFNCTNGSSPAGLLVAEGDRLVGVTQSGASGTPGGGCLGGGTIFQMTPEGSIQLMAEFVIGMGSSPSSGLVKGRDGNYYGTTAEGVWGGSFDSGCGTVFRLSSNNVLTTLVEFSGTNGSHPYPGLVEAGDGNFYGTTIEGGIGFDGSPFSGFGTVFRVTPNGVLTTLHKFEPNDVVPPGWGPVMPGWLTADDHGNLYGTTWCGGSHKDQNHQLGFGTIFCVNTNGDFSSLVSFAGDNGYAPGVLLVLARDGNLYGATSGGGSTYNGTNNGHGTVFRFTPGGELTTLHEFTGAADGGHVMGGLVQGYDDCFYGATTDGGASGYGTFFRITATGVLTTLYAFTKEAWLGGITQGKDGRFYIPSVYSLESSHGHIYRLSVPMPPVFQPVEKHGDVLNLTWSSVAEQAYQLQYASTINSTNWTDLGDTITATNGTTTVSDAVNEGKRFYRVVLLP